MIEFYKFAAVDVAAGKKGGFLSVFIALRQEQNPTNSALDIVVQGSGKPLLCSYQVSIVYASRAATGAGTDKLWPRDTQS
jgi:hypothetical protein